MKNNRFKIVDLGLTDYLKSWDIQKNQIEIVINNNSEETIFLCEHPPVYTLGRSSKLSEIIAKNIDKSEIPVDIKREPNEKNSFKINGITAYWINRGGGITFHGPGQLVIYPIIILHGFERNIKNLLTCLEEFIIYICSKFNIRAFSDSNSYGVWTDRGKIASIGVGIKRSILYHGISFNIDCDLSYFKYIEPCGIRNCQIINLNDFVEKPIDISVVINIIKNEFNKFWINYWNNLKKTTISYKGNF